MLQGALGIGLDAAKRLDEGSGKIGIIGHRSAPHLALAAATNAARARLSGKQKRGADPPSNDARTQVAYEAGRKIWREYHGIDATLMSCSEPSNSGASFGPEALNESF